MGIWRPILAGNMLIISDRASNVSRIVRIIERMDESGDEPIEVIPLHNAGAAEVVRVITFAQFGRRRRGRRGAGQSRGRRAHQQRPADRRASPARCRLKALILNMDTPSSTGGDIQVRYLRYADAEKIAEKLKGQATATAKAQGGPAVQASVQAAARAAPPMSMPASPFGRMSPTNALIITAPPKIMKSLMAVIDKLDIRRAQVQVEAIIVEVDVNKSSNLGVQWLLFGQGGSTVPAGIINLPGAGTSIVDLRRPWALTRRHGGLAHHVPAHRPACPGSAARPWVPAPRSASGASQAPA